MTVKKNIDNKKGRSRIVMLVWLAVLSPFILMGILLAKAYYGPLPDTVELENPKNLLATELLFDDGTLMGTYFRENRSNVKYDEIAPVMVAGLVATEDERFYEHSGIDAESTGRALFYMGKKGGASTITQQLAKMLFTPERSLSMFGRARQKFREWVIALRLEKQYTKQEIITMYLNKVDWVNQGTGIKSAAAVYFDTSPDSLKVEEAATLVGMCKNPSLFDPLRRPDTTLHRREVVLKQMTKNGFLSAAEYDSIRELPLGVKYQRVGHIDGPAPYLREIMRADLTRMLSEKNEDGTYVYTDSEGEPFDIYSDGLKVYTTIDPRMQKYAEWAVKEHLSTELQKDFWKDLAKKKKAPFDFRVTDAEVKNIMNAAMRRTARYRVLVGKECSNCGRRGKWVVEDEVEGQKVHRCTAEDCQHLHRAVPKDSVEVIFDRPVKMRVFSWDGDIDTLMSPMDSIRYYKSFLQAGMMSMDPNTGHVKAWVGGIDYKHFKYDHVRQGKRQVGSTFKPFIYATAIREGLDICMELPDQVTCFDMPEDQPDYCPQNSDKEVEGGMVTVKYALANSMNTITAWIMKQFSADPVTVLARDMGIEGKLEPVPSLCLGVADLSVREMTAANSTFVNKGVYISPVVIKRVEDNSGNLIFEARPETREALDENTSYIMLTLMKGVIDGAYNRGTGKTIGTGMRIRTRTGDRVKYANIQYPMAGKTGTTQNHSDGWFMGLTPELVTGVWVGAEDRSVRFSSLLKGQGANMALPIYGYYMNKVYADESIGISTEDFERPLNFPIVDLECKGQDNDGGLWGD